MQCEMPGAMPEPEKGPRENPSYSGSGVNFSAVTNVPHSPTREREGKRCSRRQELSLVLCHFPVRVKLFHNKKFLPQTPHAMGPRLKLCNVEPYVCEITEFLGVYPAH